jgi:hypothetical protein
MPIYEAHQAIERAFIKDKKYHSENEFRIATMNFKFANTLNSDGSKQENLNGKVMGNSGSPGLFIKANLKKLITEVVLSPVTTNDFFNQISILNGKFGYRFKISHSSLTSV